MSNLILTIHKRNSLQWVGEIYCLILLFLPKVVIQATSIYTKITPEEFWYKYTSFYFSALLIPAIIWAFAIRKRTHAIRFDIVIIGIIVKDIVMLMVAKNSQVVEYNLSLNLVLISAWSIICIIFYFTNTNNTEFAERFFDNYFVLAIMSQFLRMFLSMTTDGRYGAIGLSVGGTGYLTGLFFIYCLYYRDYTRKIKFLMMLAFLSLILSGQRTNMLFVLIFSIPYIFKEFWKRKLKKNEISKFQLFWTVAGFGILLFIIIFALKEFGFEIREINFITRVIDAMENFVHGNIYQESSVGGRISSIEAGINIIKDNPLGITNNFYDLQYRTLQYMFPTFPHNALLCCYLLWSPFFTLFCLLYLIKLLVSTRNTKSGMVWPLLYIVLYNIITGSVFLVYPYLVVTLFFISLAKCKVDYAHQKGDYK